MDSCMDIGSTRTIHGQVPEDYPFPDAMERFIADDGLGSRKGHVWVTVDIQVIPEPVNHDRRVKKE